MSEQAASGYSGYSLASALSSTLHSNERCKQVGNDNFPITREERVFSVPPSGPPPCDETFSANLIDWPEE